MSQQRSRLRSSRSGRPVRCNAVAGRAALYDLCACATDPAGALEKLTAYSVATGDALTKNWLQFWQYLFTRFMDGNLKYRNPVRLPRARLLCILHGADPLPPRRTQPSATRSSNSRATPPSGARAWCLRRGQCTSGLLVPREPHCAAQIALPRDVQRRVRAQGGACARAPPHKGRVSLSIKRGTSV
jgi:hypothetical protein